MAEAVLKSVLGKLSSYVGKELGLFLGFDQDLERLASLLTAIMATLEDAEEKQFSDRYIKDWLQKLKVAAHELDDIMDEYAYEELRLEYEGVKCCLSEMVLGSSLSSFHPMHLFFRFKISKKMEKISKRINEIAEERKKLQLTETTLERRSGVTEWRQTSSFITEPRVYGRKKDTKKLVDFLVGDASHSADLPVYPIIGLGGLGKTTLAQLIFNHERVVNHFELRIWVCVSEDFSLKRMTKAIIEAVLGHGCEDLDLEPLQRRLQDLLQSKRYLLVLDDVWDDEQENWQRLKSVLACGANGASILVTTRLSTVATIMGTMLPHELSELSENDCWELFKHRAFGPNEVEQAELVVIGKEIVKKCGGVPLAAKALGGLLRFKREEKEWVYVKDSNLWSLPHNEHSIMPALRLSYLNLPIKLRQCFAFCAIFPKDEIISKQYLIELWISNGFISCNEILDVEDVGDGVWRELYWRSFFQDIETDEFGKVTSFKMHDLVHDLAQFVSEEVCCITNDNDVIALSERIHHLLDHRWKWESSEEANSIQLHQVKSLRTYILQPHSYFILQRQGSFVSVNHCNQLSAHVFNCYSSRVLHCEYRIELSSSIGGLKHLRYLNLSWSDFRTLPESLCKLWNLQILKLNYCKCLQKLPNSLIHLKALQQFSLKGCNSLPSLPPQIGKLRSLWNLSMFIVGNERGFLLAELGQLKLKGDLHIKRLEKVKSVKDAKEANMSSKQLKELTLSWGRNERWDRYDGESDRYEVSELEENVEEIVEVLQPNIQQLQSLRVEGYKGTHFPRWMSSTSIRKLTIYRCGKVEGLQLNEVLQHMTALKELELRDLPKLESLPDCFGNLPSLHRLTLYYLPKLESLPDCFGNLPLLRQLLIYECSKLRCLPMSLSLSSLEWLRIWCCRELEKRCEKETGEDWPKIAHIPRIEVDNEL